MSVCVVNRTKSTFKKKNYKKFEKLKKEYCLGYPRPKELLEGILYDITYLYMYKM